VARGFSHIEGVDYDDTYALVARYSTKEVPHFYCCKNGLENPSHGCEDRISEQSYRGGGVC